ncbi:MAG TPA: hypothetical protein VGA56_17140 [Opitutaceae bacterium]
MSANAALQLKKTLADAIRQKMARDKLSINSFAKKTKTGRNAIKRILDRRNTAITLKTMAKAAEALDLELTLSAKPLSVEKLDKIAQRMVAADTPEQARRLQEEYIAGFYGKPVHAQTAAVEHS